MSRADKALARNAATAAAVAACAVAYVTGPAGYAAAAIDHCARAARLADDSSAKYSAAAAAWYAAGAPSALQGMTAAADAACSAALALPARLDAAADACEAAAAAMPEAAPGPLPLALSPVLPDSPRRAGLAALARAVEARGGAPARAYRTAALCWRNAALRERASARERYALPAAPGGYHWRDKHAPAA